MWSFAALSSIAAECASSRPPKWGVADVVPTRVLLEGFLSVNHPDAVAPRNRTIYEREETVWILARLPA